MIDYSSLWNDGSLTAAFGRYHNQIIQDYKAREDREQLKAEILAEVAKMIDQRIDIQIKNEASPALNQLKKDLQNLCG